MNKTTKTFTYIIGIVMTFAMVGSLILPMLSNQLGQVDSAADAARPTPLPTPTLPPPPDTSTIDFDNRYLHRSGLFTVGAPTGWLPVSDSNSADELRAGLGNSELLSVVEVRINKNHSGISDADALSDFLDRTWLGHTWSGYSSWDETARRVTDEGVVRLDFNVSRGRANLIARQESWIDNGNILSVRVVTAENAPQELKFILAGLAESVDWLPAYADARFDWDAYHDNVDKHIVRYPADWEVTDADEGLPATITGEGITLVVSTVDVALANEDEASNWIENWRSGVKVRTAQAAEVGVAKGYKVSYGLTTLDGSVESGLAIMLNGTDNRLHVANLRVADLDEDLLLVDETVYPWVAVLDSFRHLPNLEISVQ